MTREGRIFAPRPRPFVKWAGGKRTLAKQIVDLMPCSINRYFEPFLGGGAVFFHLSRIWESHFGRCQRPVLSDVNTHLIWCWQDIRDNVDTLLAELPGNRHVPTEREYLRRRKAWNKNRDRSATNMLYLNRYCFNGLWRENKRGEMNTPWGKNPKAQIDRENLKACSEALQGVTLAEQDFSAMIAMAGRGALWPDVVYCDPPYMPEGADGFTAYRADGFSGAEAVRLEQVCSLAARRGAFCIVSESDTPEVREIFKDWEIHEVTARRQIACKTESRKPRKELILVRRPEV